MAIKENLGDATLVLKTQGRAFKKGLDKAKTQAKATSKSFDALKAAALGALGGAVFLRAAKSVLDATIQQERADRLLENAVRATGMAAGFTANQLKAQAAALQQMTTVGDEAIQELQVSLLAFRNITGQIFTDTTKLILDFAAATGRKAARAARMLGKAINDPISSLTVLRDIGLNLTPVFEANVRAMVEMGDIAGAQRLLIDELSKSYGGAAAAARDTLGGALISLKNNFGDLILEQKDAGKALKEFVQEVEKGLPIIVGLATAVAVSIRGIALPMLAIGQTGLALLTGDFEAAAEAAKRFTPLFLLPIEAAVAGKVAFNEAQLALASFHREQANVPSGGGGGPTGETPEQMQKRGAALEAINLQMGQQFALAEATGVQKAMLAEQLRLENQLTAAGIDITRDDVNATIEAAVQQTRGIEVRKLAIKAMVKMQAEQKRLIAGMKNIAMGTATSIGAMTSSLAQGKLSFADFTSSIIKMIAQMVAKMIILKTLGASLGGGFASGFVGGFAEGGFIPPGKFGLTGEDGPELTFGGRRGVTVIPPASVVNNRTEGGNVENHFHAHGIDFGSQEAVEKFFETGTAMIRSGNSGLKAFSSSLSDQETLEPGRAFG